LTFDFPWGDVMDHDERWREVCQPKLNAIEAKLDDVLAALKGRNGDPGLCDRVRDLERSRASAGKLIWALLLTAVAQLAIWVRSLFTGG